MFYDDFLGSFWINSFKIINKWHEQSTLNIVSSKIPDKNKFKEEMKSIGMLDLLILSSDKRYPNYNWRYK